MRFLSDNRSGRVYYFHISEPHCISRQVNARVISSDEERTQWPQLKNFSIRFQPLTTELVTLHTIQMDMW
jgi:hypothetical protein